MYGVTGGTATITYSNPFGCVATLPVTINALPVISNILFTNPTTCQGADGTITLSSFATGSYTIDYTFNGAAVPTVTLSTSGASLPLTGLVQGNYDNFVVDENNLLKIIVDKLHNAKESIDLGLIKLLTKSDENLKKANEIILRGTEVTMSK